MADFGLFIGFGQPVRGREAKAAQVFNEAVELWARWQQKGTIESFEAVFLEPHGGDLGGFFLLWGERDALALARVSDELSALATRAQLIVDGFGIVGATGGERIGAQMQLFLQSAGELA
ncbi:MAG: hypothetical protein C4305_00615 [Thermoleophilia bacterium]